MGEEEEEGVQRISQVAGVCGVVMMLAGSTAAGGEIRKVPSFEYPTIWAAYEACRPGDTVIVADGIYTGHGNADLYLKKGGKPGAPITIEAANVGGAVIDGQNKAGANDVNEPIFFSPAARHIVLKGFQIRNGYKGGIQMEGSYNLITACNIYSNGCVYNGTNGQDGIYSDPATTGNAYIGNYIYDNGRMSRRSILDHGMYLCGTNELVVSNVISGNCEHGIQVAGYTAINGMKIYGNTLVSNRNGSGIMLWMTMHGVDIACNTICGNAGCGIKTCECVGEGVWIRNNVFWDNGEGVLDMTANRSKVGYSKSGNVTERRRQLPLALTVSPPDEKKE